MKKLQKMGINKRSNLTLFLSLSEEYDSNWIIDHEHQLPIEVYNCKCTSRDDYLVGIFAKCGYLHFFLSRVGFLGRHYAVEK